jgi:uncharacterized protein (TIGR00369 family)
MSSPSTLSHVQSLLAQSLFHQLLGLRLEKMDLESQVVVIASDFNPAVERSPGTGQYHGGVIASIIDIAGDFALIAILGHGVPTINFRVDYLRPAGPSGLLATASVRRAGRTVGVVDVEVESRAGQLVALGRGCYGTREG